MRNSASKRMLIEPDSYNIARFGESGATDFSFRFEYQKPAYSGFLSSVALDSFIDEDDHVLVAGRFFTDSLVANNISSLRQLCRVDSTGMPDSEFPMLR